MARTLEEIALDVLCKTGRDFGIDVDETDPLAPGHYADAHAAILAGLREARDAEREAAAQRVEAKLANLRAIGLPLSAGVERALEEAAVTVRAGDMPISVDGPGVWTTILGAMPDFPQPCPACESPEKWGGQHAPWCPRYDPEPKE